MPDKSTFSLAGTDSSFRIAPHNGGMAAALRLNGREILYTDAGALQGESMTVHGGIPILFPVCGALRDDTWNQEGRSFPMPKHGLARLYPWTETGFRQAPEEAESTWELASRGNKALQEHYPYDFVLRFTYRLKPGVFRIITRVISLSDREMPFSLGLHPYFTVGDTAKVRLDLAAKYYEVYENGKIHPVSGKLPAVEFPNSLIVHGLKEKLVTTHEDGRPSVELSYSEHFRRLVIWSGHPGHLCLEPWTALPDALNTGIDLIRLEPFAAWEAWMEITVGD